MPFTLTGGTQSILLRSVFKQYFDALFRSDNRMVVFSKTEKGHITANMYMVENITPNSIISDSSFYFNTNQDKCC